MNKNHNHELVGNFRGIASSEGSLYTDDEHVYFILGLNGDMFYATLYIDGDYKSRFYLMK